MSPLVLNKLLIRLNFYNSDFKIEILASEFTPDTTSDGAAGYWEPVFMSDTPHELVERWSIDTYL